jgi:predicted aspartyl protease
VHVFLSLYRRLIATLLLIGFSTFAHAVSCHVTHSVTVSLAQEAFLHGKFEEAVHLYQKQLEENPKDTDAIVGLVRVLLRQQKVKEAGDLITPALDADPNSVPLLVAAGEVQYRAGQPWIALETAESAMKLDACNPQLHLLNAKLDRLNSLYASSEKEIRVAHSLSPDDPDIRLHWLGTLPRAQRITELQSYLASSNGHGPDEIKHLHSYLDYLQKESTQPHKPCRLVSNSDTTTIPFTGIMQDAYNISAWALDVKLNNHYAKLAIDTGASGLVISRSVANRAGLQRFSNGEVGGVGDHGDKAAYTALVDSIKIGSLEFRDCEVEVLDQRNVVDTDGLIGMDVFSNFLVTLDYPMHQLALGPLPPRPNDVSSAKPALRTEATPDDEASNEPQGFSSGAAEPAAPRDRYIAPEMKDWTYVYRVGHNLLIPTSLNSSKVKLFILDTGAFTTSISPAIAREVTKVHTDSLMTIEGVSGKVNKVFTADKITFRFAHLSQKVEGVVAFDSPYVSRSLGMEFAGFIGFTTLRQTTMKIDYRDGLVNFSYDADRGYRY